MEERRGRRGEEERKIDRKIRKDDRGEGEEEERRRKRKRRRG